MRSARRLLVVTLFACALALSTPAPTWSQGGVERAAKNIVLFIGDGMGLSHVAAAAYHRAGSAGESEGLFFETYPVTGYITTHSADSLITDSAAAGTAMACGVKTQNGVLGLDAAGNPVESILDHAEARGMSTALVSSVPLGHATPAAFVANVEHRHMHDTILNQYLEPPVVEVILGGGMQTENHSVDEVEQMAGDARYTWLSMDSVDSLATVQPGDRLFGFFDESDDGHLAHRPVGADSDTGEPRLVDLATAALTAVGDDPEGFFLMVEGGAIDWASHANEYENAIGETLEFDAAIQAVHGRLEAMGALDDTLIIVTADHETGGLMLTGPYGQPLAEGQAPDDSWASTNHTALPVLVWARGPGSDALAGRHDNTDIFRAMRDALRD